MNYSPSRSPNADPDRFKFFGAGTHAPVEFVTNLSRPKPIADIRVVGIDCKHFRQGVGLVVEGEHGLIITMVITGVNTKVIFRAKYFQRQNPGRKKSHLEGGWRAECPTPTAMSRAHGTAW